MGIGNVLTVGQANYLNFSLKVSPEVTGIPSNSTFPVVIIRLIESNTILREGRGILTLRSVISANFDVRRAVVSPQK